MSTRRAQPASIAGSAFAGCCFPPDVTVLAVRWHIRFALSYRDVEELLAERGVEVDHVTIYRWVQRFTPLLAEAARPCRHAVGQRWFVDETYVKVSGRWRYVPRGRSVWAGHRRVRRCAAGYGGSATVLRTSCRYDQDQAQRSRDRPGADVPGCAGGAAGRPAPDRSVRQQPNRGRPRPAESAAWPDARPQAGLPRQGRDRRGRPSSRTSGEGTTSWRSRRRCACGWRSRLTSAPPWRSEASP
jgi:hypothetical protein